ncbi:hypothetical protein [Mesorhizobium sp. Mes31]|uniref:hypothetical protein n=1 Tax=Mesorhizobium sp. Mes31 TaxID=2926017 RepID=UPI002119AFE3|nr:hypothetical protein [Mesorhizobium sp. Mes31]
MSLPVLVAIVVLGIALSVAAVHFTGGSKTAALAGPDQALTRFAEDFPDDIATRVRLTADARTAFLDIGQGRIGIVHGIGDCFLTRASSRLAMSRLWWPRGPAWSRFDLPISPGREAASALPTPLMRRTC